MNIMWIQTHDFSSHAMAEEVGFLEESGMQTHSADVMTSVELRYLRRRANEKEQEQMSSALDTAVRAGQLHRALNGAYSRVRPGDIGGIPPVRGARPAPTGLPEDYYGDDHFQGDTPRHKRLDGFDDDDDPISTDHRVSPAPMNPRPFPFRPMLPGQMGPHTPFRERGNSPPTNPGPNGPPMPHMPHTPNPIRQPGMPAPPIGQPVPYMPNPDIQPSPGMPIPPIGPPVPGVPDPMNPPLQPGPPLNPFARLFPPKPVGPILPSQQYEPPSPGGSYNLLEHYVPGDPLLDAPTACLPPGALGFPRYSHNGPPGPPTQPSGPGAPRPIGQHGPPPPPDPMIPPAPPGLKKRLSLPGPSDPPGPL